MFRATSCLLNARTLLHRCRPFDYNVTQIHRVAPNAVQCKDSQQRKPCPLPPPPPKKRRRDQTMLWTTITILLISAIGIVTAKQSPEIRDWLTLYASWVDDLVAIIYEENMSHGEFADQCIENIKKYIDKYNNPSQPKPCSLDKKPPEIPVAPKDEDMDDEDEDEDEKVCQPEPPPVVTNNICDMDKCIKELGEFAVNNFETGKAACVYYNELVEETMNTFTVDGLKKLHAAEAERKNLVWDSLNNACNAIRRLDDIYCYLDCGVQATKAEIENTRKLIEHQQKLYDAARMQYQWANDESIARDKQWHILEETIDNYTIGNEAIYPGLKYTDKRPQMRGGDPDVVLFNTYRVVSQLNSELKDGAAGMTDRVNRAYDGLPVDPKYPKARKSMVDSVLNKKRRELNYQYKQRSADQQKNNDELLKTLTQKQLEKHEVSLEIKLKQKEEEVLAKFHRMVAENLASEKKVFAEQLDDMAKKLKTVEDKLNARLKAERETRRSQELWAASASLLAATKKGGSYVNVAKELSAIEKASDGQDKLVLTVLKSIPASVREKGLVPESVLKERYKVMESAALKVALVEQDGGPMPVYILSWLQALLLFMKLSGIPQDEFEKPPAKPCETLDTFDLLQRARFWVERGNFPIALRYVNGLKGASRLAADQWYQATRAHLQVRQAAEALQAHAVAMGLQYI